MTRDEALKMAIDYLDGSYEAHKVRKACQEALEQPVVKESLTLQKPLSDEEITKIADIWDNGYQPVIIDFAREIEKHHGIH